MGVFLVIGFGMVAYRWRDLKAKTLTLETMSRENWLGVGSALLLASAFIVTVGTSWPLLMPQFGLPKAKLDISFYDSTHIWIVTGILLVNGLSVLLQWKKSNLDRVRRSAMIAAPLAAVLSGLVALLAGLSDPLFLLLLFGAFFALSTNLWQGYLFLRSNWRMTGAYVAHVGLAVLVLGVIATAGYTETEHVQLVEGEPTEVFGYEVLYVGEQQIEREKRDREKFRHTIELRKGGGVEIVQPVVFWSDFNNRESSFQEPGILYRPTSDLYVSPKSLAPVGGDPTFILGKGESFVVPQDSSVRMTFVKFEMANAMVDSLQKALLEVTTPDTTVYVLPARRLDGRYNMVDVPATDLRVGFAELQADREDLSKSRARIRVASESVASPPEKRAITVDISVKPFILLVWGGVIVMVLGFFISMIRRRRELAAMSRLGREEVEGARDTGPPSETDPESRRVPSGKDSVVSDE